MKTLPKQTPKVNTQNRKRYHKRSLFEKKINEFVIHTKRTYLKHTYTTHLKKHATRAELLLQKELLLLGIPFHFQHPIDTSTTFYIADFYFPRQNVVVELDGSSHIGRQEQDAQRDKELKKRGIKTIRIPNTLVFSNIKGVVDYIIKETGIRSKKPSNHRTRRFFIG